jgi:transcriptional regulator NrdR family protein
MIACPKCNSESTRVRETRNHKEKRYARRRMECDECDHRFTTIEVVAPNARAVSTDPVLISRSALVALTRALDAVEDED